MKKDRFKKELAGKPIIFSRLSEQDVSSIIETFIDWLYRQDQIQKMVGLSTTSQLGYFYGWAFLERDENDKEQWEYFPTYEQLWLAFYMHEKHQKTWTGTEWVKE